LVFITRAVFQRLSLPIPPDRKIPLLFTLRARKHSGISLQQTKEVHKKSIMKLLFFSGLKNIAFQVDFLMYVFCAGQQVLPVFRLVYNGESGK
jgi:hypothetical protein